MFFRDELQNLLNNKKKFKNTMSQRVEYENFTIRTALKKKSNFML